jgi:hypothetical protein
MGKNLPASIMAEQITGIPSPHPRHRRIRRAPMSVESCHAVTSGAGAGSLRCGVSLRCGKGITMKILKEIT